MKSHLWNASPKGKTSNFQTLASTRIDLAQLAFPWHAKRTRRVSNFQPRPAIGRFLGFAKSMQPSQLSELRRLHCLGEPAQISTHRVPPLTTTLGDLATSHRSFRAGPTTSSRYPPTQPAQTLTVLSTPVIISLTTTQALKRPTASFILTRLTSPRQRHSLISLTTRQASKRPIVHTPQNFHRFALTLLLHSYAIPKTPPLRPLPTRPACACGSIESCPRIAAPSPRCSPP